MSQNKRTTLPPVALTTTLTTNILNPPATTGGVGCGTPGTYIILLPNSIIANKTASAATYSLWKGATGANAAGTELAIGVVVPANSSVSLNDPIRLDVGDFLVGGSNTATALTFHANVEFGIA